MELNEEIKRFVAEYGYERSEDILLIAIVARHFYELGCRRTAEKADEIEYNRQRAEESVPTDLEEAANKFAVFYDQGTCDGIAQDCFIAGAKWMKEQDEKEQADLFTIVALDAAQRAREQMMKEAISGNAYPNDGEIWVDLARYGYKFKEGEPCRIIIVKED